MADVIQLRRTKGWHKPEGAVIVARTTGGPSGIGYWGNPFPALDEHGDEMRQRAEDAFRSWLTTGQPQRPWHSVFATPEYREDILRRIPELRGKTLLCWCPQPGPCHAHVLAELADSPPSVDRRRTTRLGLIHQAEKFSRETKNTNGSRRNYERPRVRLHL